MGLGLALVLVLLVGLRLVLPYIDSFRPQIAELVSDLLDQTVSIEGLEAEWRGWKTIELNLTGISLLNEAGTESVLELKKARITIDAVTTLFQGQLQPGNLVVSGARIALIREPDGRFAAEGLEEHQDEPAEADPANAQPEAYVNWVLSQRELGLESATLVWHDRGAKRDPITLTDVNITTRFDGDSRHRVSGSASLPLELGDVLAFELDILGDPLSRDWSGSVALQAHGVHLSALSGVHDSFGLTTAHGRISVDVETDWTKTRLTTSTGSYRLESAELEWSTGTSSIDAAAGDFRLERADGGWNLTLDQKEFASRHGEWPAMQARVQLTRGDEPDLSSTFHADIGFARIEDMLPLAVSFVPQKLQSAFSYLRVQGDVRDLVLEATLIAGELTNLNLDTAIEGLATPTRGHVPGLSGLSGRLQTDLFQGRFILDSETLTLTIPGVFRQPQKMAESTGEITWKRRGTGWWFETAGVSLSNPDISSVVLGKLHWPYGNSLPIFDMGVQIKSANLAHLDNYLPVGLLRPRFASWMQRAVKAGHINDAEVWYRGYAGDFPFDRAEGLRASGQIEDVSLEYSKRWPPVANLSGEFRVKGKSFELAATSGVVYGGSITGGTATIADLSQKEPTLRIATSLSGPAATGVRFLREGNLAERFRGFAAAIEANGDIDLRLDVTVPLPRGPRSATGKITLLDNTLALTNVDITLTNLNGEVSFSTAGLNATGVEALYLDTPISIDVGRSTTRASTSELLIQGRAHKTFLLRQLHKLALFSDPADPPRILTHINGATDWQAAVELPDKWGKTDEPAELKVVSSLAGLGLSLPAPFGKPPGQKRRLVIDTRFSRATARNVKIRYGPDIGSQFELEADKEGYLLKRGAVVFGDSTPELPAQDGLYVGGRLQRLSIDHWSEVVTGPDRVETTEEPADYPILRVLKEVEIRTNELELLGNVFDGAHINVARNEDNRWNVRVKGSSVDGEVVFPTPNERGEPIVISLDTLRLGKIDENLDPQNRYDPRRFPPLKFSARNLIYDEVNVGTVKFSTSARPEGLSVDSLLLLADGFEATSVGTWTLVDERHHSEFITELHADKLDQLLRTLGHGEDTSKGGATDILATLDWPGSPSQFSLQNVSGVVHLRANRGRLLDINPGATGRLVGFLMMASLPRRLKLDFSDLFAEGMVYDLIEGSFAIENGHAYTNNLLVESEAARIEIAGRTGLIAEDYDQVVTITPRLASSLPLAPVWLLEKVLQRKVFDKAFSYQYTITGDWEDPLIERIAIETQPRLDVDQAER